MQKILLSSTIIAVCGLMAGCQIPMRGGSSGPGLAVAPFTPPPPPVIDEALADPCIEAAMAKYFIDATRVQLLSSSVQGGATVIPLKADTRDAVCTVSAKGKVISLVDTTPKSENQILAEEAAAKAKAEGAVETKTVVEPKPKKKKPVKKPAAKKG
jgi:hypothetical protein